MKRFSGLQKMAEQFPDKYPTRMGQIWNDDETLQLLKAVRKGETIEQMSKTHERTIGGITAKLKSLACDYHFNENRSIDEIMKFTGLSKAIIVDAISRRQAKITSQEIKESPKQTVNPTFKITPIPEIKELISNDLLVEIRDLLKEILELQKNKKNI